MTNREKIISNDFYDVVADIQRLAPFADICIPAGNVCILLESVSKVGLFLRFCLDSGKLRDHEPLCILPACAEAFLQVHRKLPRVLSLDQPRFQQLIQLCFQHVLVHPDPVRIGGIVE